MRPVASLRARAAFTLLEMLIALVLMVIAMSVAYTTFGTVSKAWQRGVALSDRINHGDFLMEQLVTALRSTYYPDAAAGTPLYGFWLDNFGDGPGSSDRISWVKLGSALVARSADYVGAPHRVMFSVEPDPDADGRLGAAVRGWRAYGQTERFNPMRVEPLFLSGQVLGFNCRIATNAVDDEIEWRSEWDETNRIPFAVEVTLYLEPLDEGSPPVKIKRAISLPVAPQSWRF